jgi:hypothetical protein
LRAAQSALAAAANQMLVGLGRGADLAGIGDRLGEVAASADTATQLRDGILGADDLVAGHATPAAPTKPGRRGSKTKTKAKTRAKDAASAPDAGTDAAAKQAAEDARAAARAERESVVRARRESVRLAATADKAVKRVTQQRDRSAESVADAEHAVVTAREALARARSARDALDTELAAAESAAACAHSQTAELDERLGELRGGDSGA